MNEDLCRGRLRQEPVEERGLLFRGMSATDSEEARNSGWLHIGISGRVPSEWVADLRRNQWPDWVGIRRMVLLWTSGQNIDRLVTIFKACRKAGRQLILDLYTAEILREIGNPKLPQAAWNDVRVFLPASQKRQIKRSGRYDIPDRYRTSRIFPEDLADAASLSVMLFRPSMAQDLEKAGCLKDAGLIYSLWLGYLKQEKQRPFIKWLKKQDIPLVHCHTSGHASPEDLQRYAKAIAAKMLVPIHSFAAKRFKEYFDNVEMKEDGQWWEVPGAGD